MSIGGIALTTFSLASAGSPDKIETCKEALLKKLDVLKEKAEKKVKERFSDIIDRASAPFADHNQIRYEVKTIAVDLLNLFRGKEKAKEYKFESKETVFWEHLIENIKKLESLILQASDLRFQKFRQEIRGCKNISDFKKTIQNAKQFADDFVEIMQRERKLSSLEIPPPLTLEVTPIIDEAPAQTSFQQYCESLREEMREVIASDAASNQEDKKIADSRIMAMNGLLNFALDNPELFQDYFKPEHRKAVINAILVVLKDKNLSPSLASKDSAELMTFYSKIYTKIKSVLEAKTKAQQ